MRILFVTPDPPYAPVDGARRFVYHLVGELARKHELSLVSFEEVLPSDYGSLLRKWYADIHLVQRPSRLPRPLERTRALVDSMPLWARVCSSKVMGETLIRVCGERSFDVVHLDTGLLAQYADSVQSLPAVIAPHDCMTLVLHELARVAPDPLRRFFFRHQGGKMRRYESWFYPQFQMCWVVSHVDRQYLAGFLSDENLAVIPYGVDTDHFAPQKRETARPCIGFVGVMDYPPNNDAALFFARQVLPLIWRKCPEVGFTVIGRNPGPQVKELVADERIIVTGAVENNDVRPWIAAQTIMVAPVRAQGGNKNKVFEALAMGKATVCTPVCTEGLDLVDGRHLWVGSSPAALAECCIRLIRNDHLREQLEQNGRAWALDHSWSEIAKRAEDLYLKTIEKYRVRSYSR